MGKYDPLRDYLRRQKATEFELSFAEIERKLGYLLPNSASASEWWSLIDPADTRRSGQVQRAAWLDAGFDACLIEGADRVRFRRIPPPATLQSS
ncbi:MAG: hypothetical protein EON90_05425 [Brevundimonas sp.]|nr:MAG: hypothetical protein EON90_05425 [Brevundimonas sp.]